MVENSLVAEILSKMTLAEKIGQMTQVEKGSISPAEVGQFAIGSVLSGGGGNPRTNNPGNWAAMVRAFLEGALESRLGIPLIYGVDAVHGHNNVYGATIFPHNIGLGATRSMDLVEQVGRITGQEMLATNVHWDFAPCVAVPQDPRWGRTYEGYGEDTNLVSALGAAYVRGQQNADALTGRLATLACAKHFVGDGGTSWGSTPHPDWVNWWHWKEGSDYFQIDQGDLRVDEATLREWHLAPYRAAIAAGVGSIMVSYSSWQGQKMHGHGYLLSEVLKGELGFSGFLISDWMAVDQLDPDYDRAVVGSINAGLDMIMVPMAYRRFMDSLTRAVEAGLVPMERIDDAVYRILTVKARLGLFEQPFGDLSLLPGVGSSEHRAVARQAVRQSLVLLKNENECLPLSRDLPRLFLAGKGADNIGLQCGGWTVEWLGGWGEITPGTSLLEALREAAPNTEIVYDEEGQFAGQERAPVGIVVIAEHPYAEGLGDRSDLHLPEADLALLERVRARCDRLLVILFSGRPLLISKQLPEWDAFVAAWLPGTEGNGITDVLFNDNPFNGRLPYSWPRSQAQIESPGEESPLFPYGYGL